MRLECIKYQWDESTEPEEVNFFGTAPTEIETIDLVNYLERNTLSDVEYTFEDKNEENILYIEASSLRMSCINLATGQTVRLQDFFEVYSSDNLNKWKLNYYDDSNELIYTGIIYKEGVKYPNPKAVILNILTVGYEREFFEYYTRKPLLSGDNIAWHTAAPINYTGLRINSLTVVLGSNFQGVTIPLSQSLFLLDYSVLEWGYTVAPETHMDAMPYFHVKCGYRNFADEGVSRFDYFNGMFQAMGWVWYFYLGKLYIKQRSDLTLGINTISADRFISHSVESTFNNKADIIIIEDGEYYANIGILDGNRAMYFSEKLQYYNIQRPMRDIDYSPPNYEGYYFARYDNWTFSKVAEGDGKNFKAQKFTTGSHDPFQPSIDPTIYNYPTWRYTRISPVINSRDYANGLDFHNPRANTGAYFGNGNFISVSLYPQNVNQTFSRGNPANTLIKYLGSLINKYRSYEGYCNTVEFRNNFKTMLRNSASVNIKVSIKELITNPFQNFQITDYSYSDKVEGKTFFLNKLSFNAQSRITNLELYTI